MKLLVVLPSLPYPPRSGAAHRNGMFLMPLARAHRTTLVVPGPGEGAHHPAYAACEAIVTVPAARHSWTSRAVGLARGRADLAQRTVGAPALAALDDLLARRSFDVALVEGLEMAQCLRRIVGSRGRPAVVYDAHNVEWLIQARAAAHDRHMVSRWGVAVYSALQASRLRTLERDVCLGADRVTCVSRVDAARLHDLSPDINPVVLPSSVAVDGEPSPGPHAHPPTVVFVGGFDYRPNADAARWLAGTIFPRVRADVPDATLLLVGRHPPADLLARHGRDGLLVTGEVEDARAIVSRATVSVAPIRVGSGTRIKILEALACARPVVSTSLGVEGLDLEPGRDVEIADDTPAFAQVVAALLRNPARAEVLGRRGREALLKLPSPEAVGRRMLEVIEDAYDRRRASGRAG